MRYKTRVVCYITKEKINVCISDYTEQYLILAFHSRHLFDAAKHILGYDLLKLCLEGPKESLDRTVHCQPAVFVASLAAAEKLKRDRPEVED